MVERLATYVCPCCKVSFVAVVTVADPRELVSRRDRRTLQETRTARNDLLERLGQPRSIEDPVPEIEANLLDRFARDELVYATCPGCGNPNPEGVLAEAKERRVSRWGSAAFFAGLTAITRFAWPPAALLVPAVAALFLVLGVRARRPERPPILALGLQVVTILALAGGIVFFPAWAFAVPATLAVFLLVPRKPTSSRFALAAGRIRFEPQTYRGDR